MQDARYPRNAAEGFAMALNRMLDTDRETFHSFLNTRFLIGEDLAVLLGKDHYQVQGGEKLASMHNLLNYILAEAMAGVVYATQVFLCRQCYRVAVPPVHTSEPCICGGKLELGDPAGFFAAAYRERDTGGLPIVPPLYHSLAVAFVRRFTGAHASPDTLKKSSRLLNSLLEVFEAHGDVEEGRYVVQVRRNNDGVEYVFADKKEIEEHIKQLRRSPELPEA